MPLPQPQQGQVLSERPRNKATLEFVKLCINNDLLGVNQCLSDFEELEDTKKASLNLNGYDGFCQAVRHGHVEIVQYLYQKKAFPYHFRALGAQLNPLSTGPPHREKDMLDFLVGHGWDPNRLEILGPEGKSGLWSEYSLITYVSLCSC